MSQDGMVYHVFIDGSNAFAFAASLVEPSVNAPMQNTYLR